MTNRDHLLRRHRIWWLCFGALAISAMSLDFLGTWVVGVFLLGLLFLLFGQIWFFPCLNCRKAVLPGMSVSRHKFMNPIKYCPYCGVDLDLPRQP